MNSIIVQSILIAIVLGWITNTIYKKERDVQKDNILVWTSIIVIVWIILTHTV